MPPSYRPVLPIVNTAETVDAKTLSLMGLAGNDRTRRKLRGVQRYGSDADPEMVATPKTLSRVDSVTVSTTSTVNYLEAMTRPFTLPDGEWALAFNISMEFRSDTAGAIVDMRVQLDGKQIWQDSLVDQTGNNPWSHAGRAVELLEPDDTVSGGLHTIRVDYKAGTNPSTARLRNPSVTVIPTLVGESNDI